MAADLAAAGLNTGITLWYRWPLLVAGGASPRKRRDAAELNRMVSEKLKAAADGMAAGHAEASRLATAAMTGRLGHAELSAAPASVAHAALKPAFRTVKSNAKRLRRRHTQEVISKVFRQSATRSLRRLMRWT